MITTRCEGNLVRPGTITDMDDDYIQIEWEGYGGRFWFSKERVMRNMIFYESEQEKLAAILKLS